MKVCLNCHSKVDDNALICPACGQDFSLYNKCPKCGRSYLGFSYVCFYCGNPLYDNVLKAETGYDNTEQVLESPTTNMNEHIIVQQEVSDCVFEEIKTKEVHSQTSNQDECFNENLDENVPSPSNIASEDESIPELPSDITDNNLYNGLDKKQKELLANLIEIIKNLFETNLH